MGNSRRYDLESVIKNKVIRVSFFRIVDVLGSGALVRSYGNEETGAGSEVSGHNSSESVNRTRKLRLSVMRVLFSLEVVVMSRVRQRSRSGWWARVNLGFVVLATQSHTRSVLGATEGHHVLAKKSQSVV
jgi:hypothetical protein